MVAWPSQPSEAGRKRMPYQSPPAGVPLCEVNVTGPLVRRVPLTMYSIRLRSRPRLAPSLVAICTVVPGAMVMITPAVIEMSPVTVMTPGPQVSSVVSVPLMVLPPARSRGLWGGASTGVSGGAALAAAEGVGSITQAGSTSKSVLAGGVGAAATAPTGQAANSSANIVDRFKTKFNFSHSSFIATLLVVTEPNECRRQVSVDITPLPLRFGGYHKTPGEDTVLIWRL